MHLFFRKLMAEKTGFSYPLLHPNRMNTSRYLRGGCCCADACMTDGFLHVLKNDSIICLKPSTRFHTARRIVNCVGGGSSSSSRYYRLVVFYMNKFILINGVPLEFSVVVFFIHPQWWRMNKFFFTRLWKEFYYFSWWIWLASLGFISSAT